MENVFFSTTEWAMLVLGVGGVGLWALMSIDRLPTLLRMEISKRVERSIVVEHDTGMRKS